MAKKYVRIDCNYSSLCVPIKLLEQILEQGYLVSTKWDNQKYMVDKVSRIEEVKIIDEEEIKTALAQQILEGNQ
jgi:hypothetical protein